GPRDSGVRRGSATVAVLAAGHGARARSPKAIPAALDRSDCHGLHRQRRVAQALVLFRGRKKSVGSLASTAQILPTAAGRGAGGAWSPPDRGGGPRSCVARWLHRVGHMT